VAEPAAATPSVSADFTTRHYLRFTVKDRPGIIRSPVGIFEKCGINIDSLLQKPGYLKSSLAVCCFSRSVRSVGGKQGDAADCEAGFSGQTLHGFADFGLAGRPDFLIRRIESCVVLMAGEAIERKWELSALEDGPRWMP